MNDSSIWQPETEVLYLKERQAGFKILFPKELPIFQAHFPSFAITPGLVIFHLVATLARKHLSIELVGCDIISLKFTNPILPDQTIDLFMEIKDGGKLLFEFKREDKLFAKANLGISNDKSL